MVDVRRAPRYSVLVRGDGDARARSGGGARRAIAVAIAVLLGLGALALALALRREPVPAPAFDEARDLPPLPPPADNGWTVIAASAGDLSSDPLDRRTHDDVVALLAGGSGPPDLAALERLGPALDALELDPEVERAVDAALAQPRFVVDCPLDLLASPCPVLAWVTAHRIAATLALRDSRAGWHDEALERAERMLAADRDALRGARTLLTATAAGANARVSIELAALLAASIAADEAPIDAGVRARLDALELALASLEPERWSLEHALVGEAILGRRAIEQLDGASAGAPGGALATPLFDRGRTARLLDAYYVAVVAYARDPDTVPAPAPPTGAAFLDPVGGAVLDAVVVDLGSFVDRFAERAAEAEERVGAARVVFAAARASRAGDPAADPE